MPGLYIGRDSLIGDGLTEDSGYLRKIHAKKKISRQAIGS